MIECSLKLSSLVCTVFLLSSTTPSTLFSQERGTATEAPAQAERGSSGDRSGAVGVVGSNYILKPSDIVEVAIFNEPDLRKTVRIESDNTVSLPLIGTVRIGDMMVSEAQELITALYDRDFIVNPQVSLLVLEFSMESVRVLGSVNSPGVVPLPPDRPLMLTDAIARVNGITRIGNSRNIQVRRTNPDGSTRVLEVNFDQILGDPNARDIPLRDGDTIFVRERIF